MLDKMCRVGSGLMCSGDECAFWDGGECLVRSALKAIVVHYKPMAKAAEEKRDGGKKKT